MQQLFAQLATSTVQAGVVTCLMALCFGVLAEVAGQVRSSANYQLQSDSINIGGGFATSTNYEQESTVGEVATGRSTSSSFNLQAGYQQMQEVFIGLTLASTSLTMQPALVGRNEAASSSGTTSVSVVTDSAAGYQLTIAGSDEPAMQGSFDAIADYDAGATADFTFTTGATDAHFGFTPEGPDIADRYRDNGTSCGVDSGDLPARCWDGLATTSRVIAVGSGANQPDGASTTIRFQVGLGIDAVVTSGEYVATTTITALPL